MKNKLLFLLLLIFNILSAQKLPREIFYGQLVADSAAVDNILITNKTANLATVSAKDGTFQIAVYVKDTLIFSGLNFSRQNIVLSESDLKFKLLRIKIESQVNSLDEVVIFPNALTGDLKRDSENIKVESVNVNVDVATAVATLYEDDLLSSPENKLMPGYVDNSYMMDFAAIGRKVIRALKKTDNEKNKSKDISKFSVLVQNRFSDDFFRNTLKMDWSESLAFLNFCERDPKASKFLADSGDFELIEFLLQKKEEYQNFKKE